MSWEYRSGVRSTRMKWSARASLVGLLFSCSVDAQKTVPTTYFEFGTVVQIGVRSVDIQTFDQQRQRTVQHSFALSRETRADVVHVGDTVEVVYVTTSAEWSLRRLILMADGVPVAGNPSGGLSVPRSDASVAIAAEPAAKALVPAQAAAVKLSPADAKAAKKRPRVRAVPTAAPPLPTMVAKAAAPAQPNLLGDAAMQPRASVVVPVALGSPAETKAREAAGRTHDVTIAAPAEECNRSSADWPLLPLRIAVLDFRYPTEHEESHEIGNTGGGSGTAVADLVFARLEGDEQQDERVLYSRADRRRLDRSDFAGAARLGRQLGVDAVLAGTFVPVKEPATGGVESSEAKGFELRAGIVDTCTGQLLLQTSSVACVGAISPGITAGADPSSCKRFDIKASDTTDPKGYQQDFKEPLDALLYPLEHSGARAAPMSSLSVVKRVSADQVTVQLPPHSQTRPGDLLLVRASRLAKNVSTYTLQNLQNAEIGKISIQTIQGGMASGVFTGDFKAWPGDTAEIILP